MARPQISRFAFRLGLIAAAAALVRVGAAGWFESQGPIGGDAVWYVGIAQLLARGHGFLEPLNLAFTGHAVPTASHPPLYALYLSVPDVAGLHTVLTHRLWSVIPGVLAVVLQGVLGRRLGGDRAGLWAATAGAVYLVLAVQDVILWSEGMFAFTVLLVVWLAYRFADAPGMLNAAWLGLGVAGCALTRTEGALLMVLVAVPIVIMAVPTLRARLRLVVVVVAVATVVVMPWSVYSSTRMHHPVVLSDTIGELISSSNCDATYSGHRIGGWGFLCGRHLHWAGGADETDVDLLQRRAGLRYVRDHAAELPVVIPVRLLRTFGFWQPVEIAAGDLALRETGVGWLAWVAMVQYWAYLVIGTIGVATIWRRSRVNLLPIVAPIAMAAIVSVIGYGTLRFRIGLDAVLPVLVGVGGAALIARIGGREPERAGRVSSAV